MSSSQGLTRRRGAGGGGGGAGLSGEGGEGSNAASRNNSSYNVKDSGPETSYEKGENGHKIAFDPRDMSESAERSKQPKLTMMEEVLLLGLKDKQVCGPAIGKPASYGRLTSSAALPTVYAPMRHKTY